MKDNSLKQLKILGVKVNSTSKDEVLRFVVSCLEKKDKIFVTTPNPEIVLEAQEDHELMLALNSSGLALPDGAGLKLAGVTETVRGREMFIELLKIANSKSLKVYLLGADKETNKDALSKIKSEFKKIKVDGSGDVVLNREGYSDTETDIKKYIDILKHINQFSPDILFVAFGAPKQEKWIYHNLENLNVKIAMTVGGAFDYYTGKMATPPDWMARGGLEWLWRGVQEPTRIKRIFNAVVIFPIYYFLNQKKR